MSTSWWITLAVLGTTAAYLLLPGGDAEPVRSVPTSVLGQVPPLEAMVAAPPVAGGLRAAPAAIDQAPAPESTTPGPFAPRPRPPAVLSFGAAAPLAPGQDVSAYYWGGVKPDLSD